MEAKTASAVRKQVVNFLDFGKKTVDFRHRFHQDHFMTDKSITIHWLGTIDLSQVDMSTKEVEMLFVGVGKSLKQVKDFYHERYEDGVDTGRTPPYRYAIDEDLKRDLLAAKEHSMNYFHVCLEETVNGYGEHSVDLLYNDNTAKDYKTIRGMESKVPLLEMTIASTYELAVCVINDTTQRITMLSHDEYRWMK